MTGTSLYVPFIQPPITVKAFFESGSHLSSHTVTGIVLSAALVLTVVFGMVTGVSPGRIATGILLLPALVPSLSFAGHFP